MRALASILLANALLSAACNRSDGGAQGTLRPLEPPHAMPPSSLPDPERQGGHVGRAPRRITVAQLKTNIEVTTGRSWSQLEARASSLGRADYALVNAEGTETNLVFAKFLEDGAREVCSATAAADLRAARAADRVLARELPDNVGTKISELPDAAVRANLVYLSTRFWGQPLGGEELDQWVKLWNGMAARAEAIARRDQALTATCIALMTDPRFITY